MISFFTILLQYSRAGKKFTAPYDSTQGVPDTVFIIFWLILILFGIRLAWEYRDKIFPRKQEIKKSDKVKPSNNK